MLLHYEGEGDRFGGMKQDNGWLRGIGEALDAQPRVRVPSLADRIAGAREDGWRAHGDGFCLKDNPYGDLGMKLAWDEGWRGYRPSDEGTE